MSDVEELTRLTEDWDTLADSMQREAAALRYGVARDLASGGAVVDVACGTGFGLDHIRDSIAAAVGGDLSFDNLQRASRRSAPGGWVQMDAQSLPIKGAAVDVVTCFEAIYYLPSLARFLAEAHRTLRQGGSLLVTFPNRDRPGFSPSPGSHGYPDLAEFRALCASSGFSDFQAFGAFSWQAATPMRRVLDLVRRAVSRLGLMPKSMAMRGILKRLAYRDVAPLTPLHRIEGARERLVAIRPSASERTGPEGEGFVVFYAIATK